MGAKKKKKREQDLGGFLGARDRSTSSHIFCLPCNCCPTSAFPSRITSPLFLSVNLPLLLTSPSPLYTSVMSSTLITRAAALATPSRTIAVGVIGTTHILTGGQRGYASAKKAPNTLPGAMTFTDALAVLKVNNLARDCQASKEEEWN